MMSTSSMLLGSLALLLSLAAQAVEEEGQEEKVLRLYNWADYFAPILSAPSPKRPGSGSSTT